MWEVILIVVFLVVHILTTGALMVFAYAIYRKQDLFFRDMRAKQESAIAQVEKKLSEQPNIREVEDRVKEEIRREIARIDIPEIPDIEKIVQENMPDVEKIVRENMPDVEKIVRENMPAAPDFDKLKEELGDHLIRVFEGKMGKETALIANDVFNDPAIADKLQGALQQATGGQAPQGLGDVFANKLVNALMDRFV